MPKSSKNIQRKVKKNSEQNLVTKSKRIEQRINNLYTYHFPTDEQIKKVVDSFKSLLPLISELNPTAEEIIEYQIYTQKDRINFALLLITNSANKYGSISRESTLFMFSSFNGNNLHEEYSEGAAEISFALLKYEKESMYRFDIDLGKLLKKYSIILS